MKRKIVKIILPFICFAIFVAECGNYEMGSAKQPSTENGTQLSQAELDETTTILNTPSSTAGCDGYEKLAPTTATPTPEPTPEPQIRIVARTNFLDTDPQKSAQYNKAISAYNDFLKKEFGNDEYIDHINQYDQQSGHNYGILELTCDDVPELIVKGNYVFSPYVIYAYIDGQVQRIGNHGKSGDGGSTILPNGIVVFGMDTLASFPIISPLTPQTLQRMFFPLADMVFMKMNTPTG